MPTVRRRPASRPRGCCGDTAAAVTLPHREQLGVVGPVKFVAWWNGAGLGVGVS